MKPPKGWEPLRVSDAVNPATPMARAHLDTEGRRTHYVYRRPQRTVRVQAFGNRLYDGVALTFADGAMHLSFKRRDRAAVRDWRHFQAIKNEVAGLEREAVEVYPHEGLLVDAANEYHLWVLPPGQLLDVGLAERSVEPGDDSMDWAAYRTAGLARGKPGSRQREWEPGLPTGTTLQQQVDEAAERLLASGWRPPSEQVPA